MIATKTLAAINRALEASQESDHRKHLGASVIGKSCQFKQWLIFRWAKKERFIGRMLRLFNRGHEEEARFARWLRMAGVKVWTEDPATGKQFRVSACKGHFGGSLDGIGLELPDLPSDVYFNLEFKTHADKYFKLLQNDGVANAHPEHYTQCQTYGNLFGLTHCLYMGVNKNDDELHCELIQVDPREGRNVLAKAEAIIFAVTIPPRVSKDPAFFKCKFCDFKDICRRGAPPAKNCRTCGYSEPIDDAQWFCRKYQVVLSLDVQNRSDCPSYQKHPFFFS